VGGQSQEMMVLVLGSSVLPNSIHPRTNVFPICVVMFYVPHFIIFVFTDALSSISKCICYLTMFFHILPFPYILFSIRVSVCSLTIWLPIFNSSFIFGLGVLIPKTLPYKTSKPSTIKQNPPTYYPLSILKLH
jgi:hypothetical protein